MADTKQYDELEVGDVLASGAKVIQVGPARPATLDTYSRHNPQIAFTVEHADGRAQEFLGAPSTTADMEARG